MLCEGNTWTACKMKPELFRSWKWIWCWSFSRLLRTGQTQHRWSNSQVQTVFLRSFCPNSVFQDQTHTDVLPVYWAASQLGKVRRIAIVNSFFLKSIVLSTFPKMHFLWQRDSTGMLVHVSISRCKIFGRIIYTNHTRRTQGARICSVTS